MLFYMILSQGCFAVYGFIIFIYYISHLKTDPLTQRMKFVLFNQEQEKKLGQFTLQVVSKCNCMHIFDNFF